MALNTLHCHESTLSFSLGPFRLLPDEHLLSSALTETFFFVLLLNFKPFFFEIRSVVSVIYFLNGFVIFSI